MTSVLRFKHWQVFFILILGLCLNNVRLPNNLILTVILSVTGGILYFSWIPIIGRALYRRLPKEIEFNYKLFVINSIIWLTAYTTLTILTIQTMENTFMYGQLFLTIFILTFYSALSYYMFPAKVLKSIENRRKADNEDGFWYFLLFAFLPIGIWILQPRINKVTVN